MQRCALRLRSSKDRHDVSIDAQRRELTALAAAKGLAVVAEYADAVEAANDWTAPGFRRLLLDLSRPDRGWEVLIALDTSRLARDVDLAGVFRHECRRRGVRVLFAKIPESNPLGDLITTHVYQLVDHIHSHMSREKGLAGMAENVRRGFRAGGRAPFGYRLEAVETGAVRDGAPVRKSRLVPDDNAPAVAAYLKGRAAGLPGATLAAQMRLRVAASSLVGIEWNALTYAGHTVWNVRQAQGVGAGGYTGGAKRRPRAEWIIQRDTHAALITEAEAEALLDRLERHGGKVRATRMRGADYLLSGILTTPQGARWHGDSGFYKAGRRRLAAANLERQVLEAIARDLGSEPIVRQAAALARKAMEPRGRDVQLRALQRQAADLERKIGRVRNLVGELRHPEALLPKLDELQGEKARVDREAAALAGELEGSRVRPLVTEETVRRTLAGIVESMQVLDRLQLKARLRGLLERVTVDPVTLDCCLYYAIPAGSGAMVASPRRTGAMPAMIAKRRLQLYGFRRAA